MKVQLLLEIKKDVKLADFSPSPKSSNEGFGQATDISVPLAPYPVSGHNICHPRGFLNVLPSRSRYCPCSRTRDQREETPKECVESRQPEPQLDKGDLLHRRIQNVAFPLLPERSVLRGGVKLCLV